MEEEYCERCGWPKNPLQLGTLEYYDVTIRVCFPCLAKVAGVMGRVRLEKRIGKLQWLKERWKIGREKRERAS